MKKAVIISCFSGWYEKRLEPIEYELKNLGYEVIKYASDFDHISKKKVVKKNLGIRYLRVPEYKKNISVRRIISHIVFGLKINKELKKICPDLIYLLLPPNNTARYCLKYKQRYPKTKYIVDIIDMWPESMGIQKFKRFSVIRYWKYLRNKSVRFADGVVTECDLYQKKLKKFIADEKHTTLLLYKDYPEELSIKVREILEKKKASDDKEKEIRLGYLGSINNIIDIRSICDIIEALKDLGCEVKLDIIGDGESRGDFIFKAEKAGADVSYHGKIYDAAEILDILGMCDYALNVMKDTVTVGLTIKSIDYFSMGLPIINTIKGDTWSLVDKKDIGINFDGDKAKLAKIVNRSSVQNKSENACNCYNELFTRDVFWGKVHDFFNRIL